MIQLLENVKWDLSDMYMGIDDPQIDLDLQAAISGLEKFYTYKGKLSTSLGDALLLCQDLNKLGNKLIIYFELLRYQDTRREDVKKRFSEIYEKINAANTKNTLFFDIEVGAMSQADYEKQLAKSSVVLKYKPYLDHIRTLAKYNLSEDVEKAIGLRSPFGSDEWDEFLDELKAELSFEYEGKKLSLTELNQKRSNEPDQDVRMALQKILNDGLKAQRFDRFRARALNVVMGLKNVNDSQRGFAHVMSSRNLGNRVQDKTVDALHQAVLTHGAESAKRFYKLRAKILGKDKLLWSELGSPLPFSDTSLVSWEKSMQVVKDSYRAFSPTLADLIETTEKRCWIDAPITKGKTGGAFSYSFATPGMDRSYILLNHKGTARDIATLAHELGHTVHGLLAMEAQGTLMSNTPMAYCETASIFGEMLTFQSVLAQKTNPKDKLALLIEKIDDFMLSVVLQICCSNFEKKCHERRKKGKLAVEDFNAIWLSCVEEVYGQDGDVFDYKHIDSLWCYRGHYMRPFYVYAYAFGELFTQSLFSVKDQFGDKFEGMYLDLLRAGGTKDAVALMAPFGLNPDDPSFWINGIKGSLDRWLDEAEKLYSEIEK